MNTFASLVLIAAHSVTPQSLAEVATKDVQQFNFVENGQQRESPFHYYLIGDVTTSQLLGWVLSSTSLQSEIELCLPVQVQPGLWRIDIRNLGWRYEDWAEVLAAHPYGGFSRLVRADWLVTDILDTALSASQHKDGIASYYRLLYRGAPPKTESEFF